MHQPSNQKNAENAENAENALVNDLFRECETFLDTAKVDKGHGIDHIKAVLDHVDKALLEITDQLPTAIILAIRVAAILHDVDDHKFFDSSVEGANEKFLLNKFKERIEGFLEANSTHKPSVPTNFKEFESLVKQMIDLVSCSSNGNSNDFNHPEWMLYPRIADRLEAIGAIGILRAIQYGEYRNRLMYDENTERAYTLEELRNIATPERFRRYLANKRAKTTLGHFYDKILHIGKSSDFGVSNTYFSTVAEARHKECEDWVLNFWHNLPEPYPSPRRGGSGVSNGSGSNA